MTELEFSALCRALCVALQEPDIDILESKGRVEVDGIPIGLLFNPAEAPDRLFCYADLGPVDPENRLSAYQRLLTLNLLSANKTDGYYGIEPLTGHAVFTVNLMHAGSVGATSLANTLRGYARQAHALQKSLLHGNTQPKKGMRARSEAHRKTAAIGKQSGTDRSSPASQHADQAIA